MALVSTVRGSFNRDVPQESNHHPILMGITFVLGAVSVGLVLYELFKIKETTFPPMNLDSLKKAYGEEYPTAVTRDGIRMPVWRESRFSRSYYSHEHKMGFEISRFMDATAAITASELKQDWNNWTEDLRSDFCRSCCWLQGQPDFPEMLRFIMEHGVPENCSSIAQSGDWTVHCG